MQLAMGEMEPLRRLSETSRRRSWSREERGSSVPRRLRDGRKRAVTRLEEEQRTPSQEERQASGPVQLEKRAACVSDWRRKIVSVWVSFVAGDVGAAATVAERERVRERRSERRSGGTLLVSMDAGGRPGREESTSERGNGSPESHFKK